MKTWKTLFLLSYVFFIWTYFSSLNKNHLHVNLYSIHSPWHLKFCKKKILSQFSVANKFTTSNEHYNLNQRFLDLFMAKVYFWCKHKGPKVYFSLYLLTFIKSDYSILCDLRHKIPLVLLNLYSYNWIVKRNKKNAWKVVIFWRL